MLARSPDEPFTLYGLLAETVETPEDRSWVEFKLRPQARFSDGTQVTTEDVLYSWETLKTKGRQNMRSFYDKVELAESPAPGKVRFIFKEGTDREAALLIGLMPIISKAFYSEQDFEETSLTPPLGSGPYAITDVDPGRGLTLTKVENYWGESLPINVGRNNFAEIRLEYDRDSNTRFEAFKKGHYGLRLETDPARWNKAYDFSATRNSLVIMSEFNHGRPSGMNGLVNTRKDKLSDVRVREALTLLFNFEFINDNYFFGAYKRTRSYFDNSELAATGPAGDLEHRLLAEYPNQIRNDIEAGGWTPPVNGDSTAFRANARKALALLLEAGWKIDTQNKMLVHATTGEPFEFEILAADRSMERVFNHFADAIRIVGIDADIRFVDSIEFQNRLSAFDYDMMPFTFRGTLSPGNEQLFRWGSKAADLNGTFNFAGVKNPAVDAMVNTIVTAKSREELVAATRALDRILLSGFYVIPLYHQDVDRVAFWTELQHPKTAPLLGWNYNSSGWYQYSAWWTESDN